MDVAQCDPFVTQAQALFAEVLQHRELQTELYCQLIKQTSKHPAPTKTPGVQVVYFVKLFSACDPLIMNELNWLTDVLQKEVTGKSQLKPQ